MKARSLDDAKTVSPNKDEQMIMANEQDSDGDEGDVICEPCGGDIVERISKDKEDTKC